MSSKTTTSIDAQDDETGLARYLAERPRMMGVLFMTLLLLSQAGNVAGCKFSYCGP